ncbi:uncharacterized protein EKO05_0009223 [Ascochyta rabiei]|uniref:uncharacterized protein n=1 Tax=Didymella rabiei TaxID=5454 RepID=UPI0021FDD018|nr:uncharacterized protein EKO05_0009223 [Ascochyta rabiei]UPX18942.1 hypothetical protein EKO05_0009223 [Ascochyta rabiei]
MLTTRHSIVSGNSPRAFLHHVCLHICTCSFPCCLMPTRMATSDVARLAPSSLLRPMLLTTFNSTFASSHSDLDASLLNAQNGFFALRRSSSSRSLLEVKAGAKMQFALPPPCESCFGLHKHTNFQQRQTLLHPTASSPAWLRSRGVSATFSDPR